MIYKCQCGHSSYHQGEVENPFCPKCRLNKSEIVPVPGEFKARIKPTADLERIRECVSPHWKRELKHCKTLPGEEVAVNITVYFQLDRQDGRPTHFSLPLEQARELLELPEEKLYEFVHVPSSADLNPSSIDLSLSKIKILKNRCKNDDIEVVRNIKGDVIANFSEMQLSDAEQDIRGAKNVLAAGIKGKALTAMPGIEGKLYGPKTKTKYLRTFRDILIDLMIKLRRVANLYDSSTGPISKRHMVIDIRGLVNWAEDVMDELDKVRDSRYSCPGTELELIEKVFIWIGARQKIKYKTGSVHKVLCNLKAFIERQMKEE